MPWRRFEEDLGFAVSHHFKTGSDAYKAYEHERTSTAQRVAAARPDSGHVYIPVTCSTCFMQLDLRVSSRGRTRARRALWMILALGVVPWLLVATWSGAFDGVLPAGAQALLAILLVGSLFAALFRWFTEDGVALLWPRRNPSGGVHSAMEGRVGPRG